MNASQKAKQRGARLYAAKDYAGAVNCFSEAIERADACDMDLHLYHSNRCATYLQLGRWREALEAGRLCAVAVTAFAEGITCRMEEDGGLFFLAAIYRGDHFVLLTTDACTTPLLRERALVQREHGAGGHRCPLYMDARAAARCSGRRPLSSLASTAAFAPSNILTISCRLPVHATWSGVPSNCPLASSDCGTSGRMPSLRRRIGLSVATRKIAGLRGRIRHHPA